MLFLLTVKNEADFEGSIQSSFPNEYIEIGRGQWILSTDDNITAQDAWNRIVGTSTPRGIIVSFIGYYGRANSRVWEWIAAKRNTQK